MVARMSTGLYRVMPLCKLPRIIAGLCYHRHSTCLCLAVGKELHAYRVSERFVRTRPSEY